MSLGSIDVYRASSYSHYCKIQCVLPFGQYFSTKAMGSLIQGVSSVYSPSNMWSPSSMAKRSGTSGCRVLNLLAHFSAVLKGTLGPVNSHLRCRGFYCCLPMCQSSHGPAEMVVVHRLTLGFAAGPSKRWGPSRPRGGHSASLSRRGPF